MAVELGIIRIKGTRASELMINALKCRMGQVGYKFSRIAVQYENDEPIYLIKAEHKNFPQRTIQQLLNFADGVDAALHLLDFKNRVITLDGERGKLTKT